MEKENNPPAGGEESWNKKRIFIALFLLIMLFAGVIYVKANYLKNDTPSSSDNSVMGVTSQEKNEEATSIPQIDVKGAVREKVDSIKEDVLNLNVQDVATSSPQIQKIINDIKSMEQYPSNQIKEVCRQICGL